MVALNFQTSDLSMQLNQGKFEYNGNCGCVASFLIYRLLQVSLSVTECTIIVCLVSVCLRLMSVNGTFARGRCPFIM